MPAPGIPVADYKKAWSIVVDLRQIGRELGVGYILEGNIREIGNSVRMN